MNRIKHCAALRSIRFRLLLFLFVSAVLLFGFVLISRTIFITQNRKIFDERLQERVAINDTAIRNKSVLLKTAATDYSYWDDIVRFVQGKNPSFATETIDPMLGTYKADGVWVVKPNDQIYYQKIVDDIKADDYNLGLTARDYQQLFAHSAFTHFYVKTKAGISEVYGATLVPTSDPEHKTKALGYILVGQLLDETYAADLTVAARNSVSVITPEQFGTYPDRKNAETGKLVFTRNINDLHNELIGKFLVTYTAPGVQMLSRQQLVLGWLNLTAYLLVIGSLAVAIWGWFVRPLNTVYDSLETSDSTLLRKIASQQDELGRVARLIVRDFELENQLRVEKASVEKKVELATRQLREEKVRLQTSINSLDSGILMTFVDGTECSYNPALPRLFNISKSAVAGVKQNQAAVVALLQEQLDSTVDLEALIEHSLEQKRSIHLQDIQIGDRYVVIKGAPIDFDDERPAIGCVLLVEDVTDAIIAERSKDEFFAIASHELRTPLTVIRGNAAMVLDMYDMKMPAADIKESISDIKDASVHLIAIVNQFLNMSRLEQGRENVALSTQSVKPCVEQVVSLLRSSAGAKGLQLVNKPGAKLPNALYDSGRLAEVLTNIIGNAIKYSDKGTITVSAKSEKGWVHISVKDEGKGIAETNQSKLFQKFQQATDDQLVREDSRSTGLGLYISKLIMQQMGGSIRLVTSRPADGSEFCISLQVPHSRK